MNKKQNLKFKTLSIIGKQQSRAATETLQTLIQHLREHQHVFYVESEVASVLDDLTLPTVAREKIGEIADLVIVIGGDGSMLNAARTVVKHGTPLVGINRGRLGFLTDIHPFEFNKLDEILAGQYQRELRFMLNATVQHNDVINYTDNALNDVVLLPGDMAHMIEFEIYINQQFVCRQRADGLIIATPTGSTAYALSGGGPILHPQLDAIVLVPMFPHTLSYRPIVVSGDSQIDIVIPKHHPISPKLSCDGQQHHIISPGESIHVSKQEKQICLIHPMDYNYFETLRTKLYWGRAH